MKMGVRNDKKKDYEKNLAAKKEKKTTKTWLFEKNDHT